MSIPMICIGLLGLLCFLLGFGVSMQRRRTGTSLGASADPADPLLKYVRAHGNTAEYAPIIALLIFVLAQSPQTTWVYAVMILATASRYVFAAGMVLPASLARPNIGRFLGALGTYLFGTTLAVTVLAQALA
ncbi:MAG: MAPEG family protein [Pseudomonadota bacterium]